MPNTGKDCEQLLPNGFIFQQDGAPAYTARVTQDLLKSNCSDFITKDKCPPPIHLYIGSSDIRLVDYHVWGGGCWSLTISCSQSQKIIRELKDIQQLVWSALPQKSIDNAVVYTHASDCVSASGRLNIIRDDHITVSDTHV